ncbi:ATP-binding cassette domain-containing protein [Rhodococcus qingshengii]|uniref:ATP-binding cassette domain-containing protein n=1 Tax=Rhodococcus qingshengii TaxID=334542 RepID=UPI00366721A7
MPNVEVRQITKSFGSRIILSNISMEANLGKMVSITGPSGSGKSTLLNCVGLLEKPDSGAIRIGGDLVISSAENSVFNCSPAVPSSCRTKHEAAQ